MSSVNSPHGTALPAALLAEVFVKTTGADALANRALALRTTEPNFGAGDFTGEQTCMVALLATTFGRGVTDETATLVTSVCWPFSSTLLASLSRVGCGGALATRCAAAENDEEDTLLPRVTSVWFTTPSDEWDGRSNPHRHIPNCVEAKSTWKLPHGPESPVD